MTKTTCTRPIRWKTLVACLLGAAAVVAAGDAVAFGLIPWLAAHPPAWLDASFSRISAEARQLLDAGRFLWWPVIVAYMAGICLWVKFHRTDDPLKTTGAWLCWLAPTTLLLVILMADPGDHGTQGWGAASYTLLALSTASFAGLFGLGLGLVVSGFGAEMRRELVTDKPSPLPEA